MKKEKIGEILNASFEAKLKFIIDQNNTEKQQPIDLSEFSAGSLFSKINSLKESIKREDYKSNLDSILTDPFFKNILVSFEIIKNQILKERINKYEFVKLYLEVLENTKEYIFGATRLESTFSISNIEINDLLDRLSSIMKTIELSTEEKRELEESIRKIKELK